MKNFKELVESFKGPYQRGQKIQYKYKKKTFTGVIKGVNPSDMDELLVDPGDGVLDAIKIKDVIKRL